jgi:prohibitin 2
MSHFRGKYPNSPVRLQPKTVASLVGGGLLIFVIILALAQATEVVEPGHRGVRVTLGRVSPQFEHEGFLMKPPFITRIYQTSIRQQTEELRTECYSSDLQQVKAKLRILFRVPEGAVVDLFRAYDGDPFSALVAPRVIEALKEVASEQSAEMLVQNRENIKIATLKLAREKIVGNRESGPLVMVEDILLSDLALSPELNAAIEQKMTQKQEAERAKFVQRQAEIEAETAIIKAKGEAESIEIRGKALQANPAFILLQIVEKWDGISPVVLGDQGENARVFIPLSELEKRP